MERRHEGGFGGFDVEVEVGGVGVGWWGDGCLEEGRKGGC